MPTPTYTPKTTSTSLTCDEWNDKPIKKTHKSPEMSENDSNMHTTEIITKTCKKPASFAGEDLVGIFRYLKKNTKNKENFMTNDDYDDSDTDMKETTRIPTDWSNKTNHE